MEVIDVGLFLLCLIYKILVQLFQVICLFMIILIVN